MWNLRAVSAKALIVRLFCSFRAKYVGALFPAIEAQSIFRKWIKIESLFFAVVLYH